MNSKILIFMQDGCTNTTGGSIKISIELANFLLKNNFEVAVCCNKANSDNRPLNLSENITFFDISKQVNASFDFILDTFMPDLIIFTMPSFYLKICTKYKVSNIPKILTFHSRPDFYFEYDTSADAMQKCYVNTVAQILFPSYYNLLPDFIKNGPVVQIPNYSNCITEINTIKNNKIVYLSRIDKLKGIDFLLKSFALIASKHPDWSIDIYGQSEPKEYVYEIKKMARRLGIYHQINFMGIVKNPVDVLKEYSFCVFPSLFEGFPIGLLESQCAGLPTIGLKSCSGVNELIVDNKNGFLSDYNIKSYAKKIELLIKDSSLRERMSKQTLSMASEYNKQRFEESWLECINKMLSGEDFCKIETTKNSYKLFPIEEIVKIYTSKNPIEFLFSIRNRCKKGRKCKILRILGFEFCIKTGETI